MRLGAFSVSLNVASIHISKEFYEKLGFTVVAGEIDEGWLIVRNGETTIGLFQGMLDKNMLTFNPGWDTQCGTLPEFDDVREIQERLTSTGVDLDSTIAENSAGPGSFVVVDPDGNPILFDQHI